MAKDDGGADHHPGDTAAAAVALAMKAHPDNPGAAVVALLIAAAEIGFTRAGLGRPDFIAYAGIAHGGEVAKQVERERRH